MARVSKVRHEGDRLTDLMNIGVLTTRFPLDQIHEVLRETSKGSKRLRDLPAHVMMYYVVALSLYRAEGSREVLRLLLAGLQVIVGLGVEVVPATKGAISRARSRLGVEPVRQLYDRIVGPVADAQTQGAFYRGWHVVALDGFTLETPDTVANEEAFGRPKSPSGGKSAYPLVRGVGLVEVGTHVLFGAVLGDYYTGEVTLAREVVPRLKKGMLCLADRYFPGFELWEQAMATGADLVWRVRSRIRFAEEERLPDGSCLSRFPSRRKGKAPMRVRVIEYKVTNQKGEDQAVRIITSILDWQLAPAHELAGLYAQRWEFETALDEFKTHLRGARTVLRSQTPDLIRQEVYGLLLAHFALRGLMHEAAVHAGRDPDRISFIHTVRVVRRTLPRFADIPPSGMAKPASRRNLGDSPGGRRRAPQPAGEARG
jgi:Insertion element 4 transposase N-terminal/Transposase DDE domain